MDRPFRNLLWLQDHACTMNAGVELWTKEIQVSDHDGVWGVSSLVCVQSDVSHFGFSSHHPVTLSDLPLDNNLPDPSSITLRSRRHGHNISGRVLNRTTTMATSGPIS